MEYIIYKYTSKSNGKTYVGRTSKKLDERAGNNGHNYKYCPYFFEAIEKQGWDDFEVTKLATVNNARSARKLEHQYILEYNSAYPNGYNTMGWSAGHFSEDSIESDKTNEYNVNMTTREESEMTRKLIMDYYSQGKSAKDIATELDISRSYVYAVLSHEKEKNKSDNTEQILLDKITVLEKQLLDKTNRIQKLEEDLRRKNLMIDRLLGLSSQ